MDPRSVGPYQVEARIGEGAMGAVYRARDPATGRPVAVKVARSADALPNLRAELRALMRIHDPRVVRILDHGVQDGLPWFAMELVEGRSWEDLNAELRAEGEAASAGWASGRRPAAGGRLPELLTLARRLNAALGLLHGEGLIHRDLKPANVLIRADGMPVVMDLGAVSRYQGSAGRERIEEAGVRVGTLAYMAPEQARGRRVDARADLYALGCMLYESVTGRLPLRATSTEAFLEALANEIPPPPSALAEGVPAALDALILGLLEKDPTRRLGYAEDVDRALAAMGAENPDPPVPFRPSLYRPRLVGRQAQLALLQASLTAVAGGRGGMALVVGESGAGKTALVSEASRLARARNLSVLVGECIPVAGAEAAFPDPAGALLASLRPLLVAVGDRIREKGASATRRLLGEHGRLLAAVEPSLASVPGFDTLPVPPDLPPAAARARLAAAVLAVAGRYPDAIGPLVLILDDLQWADELTIEVLRRMAAGWVDRHLLLVLGTLRSDEAPAALRVLAGQPGVIRVDLPRLTVPELRGMVSDMLAMPDPPAALIRAVMGWSEGNPFFAAEFLRVAAAEGALARQAGRWTWDERAERPLSASRSLREAIGARLSGIGEPARALAEAGAVFGREVDLAALGALTGQPAEALLGSARELEDRGVLEARGADQFRFAHDKLREALYLGIPAERRRRLHAAAARVLEARSEEGRMVVHRAIAHHWREAGELARAIDHLERAAEQAGTAPGRPEVIAMVEECFALAKQLPHPVERLREARWSRQLAEARLDLGDVTGARPLVDACLATLGEAPLPEDDAAARLPVLGQLLLALVQALVAPAFRATGEAEVVAAEAASLHERMIEPARARGAAWVALYSGLRGLNLASRLPSGAARARAQASLAVLAAAGPLAPFAAHWARLGVRGADTGASAAARVHARLLGGEAMFRLGETAEAARWLGEALALASASGEARAAEGAGLAWAEIETAAGRLGAALARARDALGSAEARDDRAGRARGTAATLALLARLGRFEEARLTIRRMEPDAAGLPDEDAWRLHAARGGLAWLAGDLDAARAALERARLHARRGPTVGLTGSLAALEAEAWLGLWAEGGDSPETRHGAAEAVEALAALARRERPARPAAALVAGMLAARRGDRRAAARRWAEAMRGAERLGQPLVLARALAAAGDRAESGRAASLFRAAEALPELARLEVER